MNKTISCESLLDIMHLLKFELDNKYHCEVHLDEDGSMLNGSTMIGDSKYDCYVGVKELYDGKHDRFDIGEAMVPIVGICHEVYGHACQFDKQFSNNTALSKVLALNYYGCQVSPVYYYGVTKLGDDYVQTLNNYWNQPYEIAAQYAGIKAAYRFTKFIWGEENANIAMHAYEEFRESRKSQMSGEITDYSKLDDLLKNMNQSFCNAVFAHKEYDAEVGKYLQDALFQYAYSKNDGKYMLSVQNMRNGLRQDWMMASVHWSHEDRNDMPVALRDIDMNVNKAFSLLSTPVKPKPKFRDLDLEGLISSIDMQPSKERENDGYE